MNEANRTDALALVVGGAGFIGSALVRALAARGQVRILDDLSTGHADNLDGVAGANLIVGSILDEATVERVLSGVAVVYHLACLGARQSIHSPRTNHETNATGTLLLLESARRAGVERFVYTSTSEVYGTARTAPITEDHMTFPHTVYGGAKLAGEAYTRAYHLTYGLPAVIVRPFNAFGPRSHHEGDSGEVIPKFLVRAMNGLPPIVFGDGSQTRDFTYVDDTARGIALAGREPAAVGRTINLGYGAEVRIDELARLVLRITDRTQLAVEHDDPRPGDVHRLLADRHLATELLGWEPTIGLEEGIRRLLEWHELSGTDWKQALSEEVDRNWE